MMNIQTAIKQMRIARRLGKLSMDQQNRLMRRMAPRQCVLRWERLMGLRASIERDVQPVVAEKRRAESEVFQYKCSVAIPALRIQTVSARVSKPALTGYENSPEWWRDAEKRERAARKGELAEA